MQYMLLIYEDERIYGPDKSGPEIQEIVARHMVFNKGLGTARVGGAGLKTTTAATTARAVTPVRCFALRAYCFNIYSTLAIYSPFYSYKLMTPRRAACATASVRPMASSFSRSDPT